MKFLPGTCFGAWWVMHVSAPRAGGCSISRRCDGYEETSGVRRGVGCSRTIAQRWKYQPRRAWASDEDWAGWGVGYGAPVGGGRVDVLQGGAVELVQRVDGALY